MGFWSTGSVPNVRDLLRGVRPGSRVSGLICDSALRILRRGRGQASPLRWSLVPSGPMRTDRLRLRSYELGRLTALVASLTAPDVALRPSGRLHTLW